MEATAALLRIAARVAGAPVALVAREHDDAPVAAWGCDADAARALLRAVRRAAPNGAWSFLAFPLTLADDSPGRLLLVAPSSDVDDAAASALAHEIGAGCDPRHAPLEWSGAIESITQSVDRLGEAVAILGTPRSDPSSYVLHVNASFTRLFGLDATELAGKEIDLLFGPLTERDRLAALRAHVLEQEAAHESLVLYGRDRAPVWVEVASMPVRDDGATVQHAVTFRDVTSRKQFADALDIEKSKLHTTLAAIAEAVVTVLGDGRVEFVNAAAQQLLGVELATARGRHVDDVVVLLDDDARRIDLVGELHAVRRGKAHLRARSATVDVAYVASPIDADERGAVIVLRDVTIENRLAMRLSFEASHDPLTGLPNRRAFMERLEEAMTTARERRELHAVGFLDLDRFKIVNDRLGHAAGDRLLCEVSNLMARAVRNGDVLARIGGDEFGLLLSNCSLDDARRVADKVRTAVESYRIESQGLVLDVGVSIGLAPIEAGTASAADALDEADAACYQAKAAGRNAIAG